MCEITNAIKESVLGVEQGSSLCEEVVGMEWCLHTAASFGNLPYIENILQRLRSDINKRNKTNWTALMYAAYYGHEMVVQLLIRKKAKINLQNEEGCTALMLASKCGFENIVQLLIQHGALVDMIDKQGWTALFHAVQAGCDQVVRQLLSNGANPNLPDLTSGITPVMLAAKEGNELLTRLFLHRGADIHHKNIYGDTAYVLALRSNHSNVVAFIDSHFKRAVPNMMSHLNKDVVAQMGLNLPTFSLVKDSGEPFQPPCQETMPLLQQVFESIGVGKYYATFVKEEIDFPMFLTLSDRDLQEIGIKLLGPRKKMCAAIERYKRDTDLKNVVAATTNFSLPSYNVPKIDHKMSNWPGC